MGNMVQKSNFGKFLLLWAGELISSVGGGLTSFGLGVYVFGQTGSAASMDTLSDGITIMIILLISVLVLLISLVCIRFLLLTRVVSEAKQMFMTW